jgi:hypothetical protein
MSGLVAGAVCGPDRADQNAGDLSASRSSRGKASAPALITNAEVGCICLSVNVRVVDRTEQIEAVVWHDPTSCHYDDQPWHRAKGAHGRCLCDEGRFHPQGADIYRPSRGSPRPVNAGP